MFFLGVRPVTNASVAVNVKFGMALIEIIDFNEESNRIHVKSWDRYVHVYCTLLQIRIQDPLDHCPLPINRDQILVLIQSKFNRGLSQMDLQGLILGNCWEP